MKKGHRLAVGLILVLVAIGVLVLLLPPDTTSSTTTTITPSALPATTRATTQPGTYFIGGRVQRPGAYDMEKAITLRQLIVTAGLDDETKSAGTAIISRNGAEQGEIIAVELGPLFRDKTGDVQLVPNDNIIVRPAKRADP